ncbi:MAG: type II toxin-antitoxin system HicB family antitoxin [Bacteroides sp.]|nr:type II toxin-antitoxin system HicB family antitoxin [Bacteroides sp.]
MKYVYPAIFTYDKEEDCYYVNFPDIENCFTDGKDLPEAIEMASDALSLMLCQMEDDGTTLPNSTDINNIKAKANETVSLVFADTSEYRRLYLNNKAVKKTLSIPCWLNTMAERNGINFSAVLQNALMEQLGID